LGGGGWVDDAPAAEEIERTSTIRFVYIFLFCQYGQPSLHVPRRNAGTMERVLIFQSDEQIRNKLNNNSKHFRQTRQNSNQKKTTNTHQIKTTTAQKNQ
jgi:hypothetical protein